MREGCVHRDVQLDPWRDRAAAGLPICTDSPRVASARMLACIALSSVGTTNSSSTKSTGGV
jgi:hypothetical protein